MRVFFVLLVLAGSTVPALSQEWRASGRGEGARAYFTLKGRPAGAEIACLSGGRLGVTAAGNGARFPADRPVTLVLSVDGMAYAGEARVEPEGAGGGSRFVRTVEGKDAASLLAALKRGKSLEVSGPAGHVRLPLTGSGRAIAALAPACAGP
ncbi:hypothetical protein [uncultured Aureimonas sp.]|uniref:hypothetical protein n=1 Tax=uncultured Aureimonas sp. TaxID=1604662 RepID=UPI0025CE716F|nr:hypothetical protein [uncultured Aureimonas sp.]